MDLHVYALLKRRYNDLADEVQKLVEDSAGLTEEAEKVLKDITETLERLEPTFEEVEENAEEIRKILEDVEPLVTEIKELVNLSSQTYHTGEYERDREYLKGNETLYNGSTYRALEDVVGVLPTDKSKWQLVAQRGVDGEGAVKSVNNISPDEDGNVDLGNISADWNSLEGKPEVLDDLGESDGKLTYKGEEVGEKLVIGRKVYVADGNTDTFETEFEIVPNSNRVMVFVSGVIQASGINFTESENSITLSSKPLAGTQVIVYTFSGSETISVGDGGGGVSIDDVRAIVATHGNVIASEDTLGHIRIGDGLLVDGDGVVSVDGNLDIDLSDYVKKSELESHESLLGSGISQGHVFLMDEANPNFGKDLGRAVTPKALHEVKEIAEKAFTQASNAREAMWEHFVNLNTNDGSFLNWYDMKVTSGSIDFLDKDSSMVEFINVLNLYQEDVRSKTYSFSKVYNGNLLELKELEGVPFEDIKRVIVRGNVVVGQNSMYTVSGSYAFDSALDMPIVEGAGYILFGYTKTLDGMFMSEIPLQLAHDFFELKWYITPNDNIATAGIDVPLNFTFRTTESDLF